MSMVSYRIFDPTGNITALVDTDIAVPDQPGIAQEIMKRHPEVEQVGFVQFHTDPPQLRMAGGEFCGNASMSAAAWYLQRKEEKEKDSFGSSPTSTTPEARVTLMVSGATQPVKVHLKRVEQNFYIASLQMPWAQKITCENICIKDMQGDLPVVWMEGIVHVIIEPGTLFFHLLQDQKLAEQVIRAWCAQLGAEGLGLMFLERTESYNRLTPLVYIPAGDTTFWEHSCGSGSCAVGIYLARNHHIYDITLEEPGGQMRVICNPAIKEIILHGYIRLGERYVLS